jgi:two-component system cell cycle response regulator
MPANTPTEIPSKPRVLIVDDSRIVRAMLIKHIQGMFDFREVLDGEQAWEVLLIDPSIRMVITDLTMPKLDGYGLLQRIRASKINRIRNVPVIVVSGSDEQEERDRAKAAGATDLITKGIAPVQLLSRLETLSKLVNTQREFELSLETLVHNAPSYVPLELSSPSVLVSQSEKLLENSVLQRKNFVVLNVCVGLKYAALERNVAAPPAGIVSAIGQLLQHTIRQTDRVAKTGEAEFTVVTGSINFDSAKCFAQRVCNAITNADLVQNEQMTMIASCGMVALFEQGVNVPFEVPTFATLQNAAHRRAMLGLDRAHTGVVGMEEEARLRREPGLYPLTVDGLASSTVASGEVENVPNLVTLLKWIREGKEEQVMRHMGQLPNELKPLVDMVLRQTKH